MKRFKIKYDPAEEVGLRTRRDPKKKLDVVTIEAYDLDTALPLRSHVEAIYRLTSPLDMLENYTLAVGENQSLQYVAPDEPLGPQLGRLPNNTILFFKLMPRLRAQYFIEALSSDTATVKELLFSLRYTLKDGEFAEEFIDQQGLSQLMDAISKSTGNIQAYALAALRAAMGYESGLNFFLSAPNMVEKLFFLTDPATFATSSRHVLELLFVLTSYNGWVLVNKAAKFTAKSKGVKPFSNMIALLKSGDVDTAVNTLTLLNSMIDNAPSKLKADKLINKLRDLNIEDAVHGVTNTTAEWKAQLAIFEANLHASAKTGPEKAKPRNTQNVNQLIDSLKAYEEQQPMLKILYAELHHYQSLIANAIQHGAFLNPNVPTDRFDAKRDALATPIIGPMGPIRRTIGKGIGGRMEGPSGIRGSMTLRKKDSVAAILGAPLEGDRDSFRFSTLIKASPVPAQPRASMAFDAPPEGVPPPPPPSVAAEQLGATQQENDRNAASAASVLGLAPPDSFAPPPPPPAFEAPPPEPVAPPPAPPGKLKATMPKSTLTPSPEPEAPAPPSGGPPPPPPALGKGPPPPPPPGKGKGPIGVQPTKPMLKPLAKMKPLHWTRILAQPPNAPNRRVTIWDTIQEFDFDREDFEKNFSAKQREGEADPEKLSAALANKGASIRVLSVKRSNAIAVMCSKLPETEHLIRAIRELDSATLEKHLIRSLATNMATPEELAQIREMVHPDITLDKPEQFCLLLAEIPDLKERLKCWEYMLVLDERLVDIGPPIISVQRACREIAKSGSLKVVLGTLLSLGNYMNGGHPKRGQADGFQIDALSKILEIKDNANRSTLLEYLISFTKDLYPEILRFPDEIPTCLVAAKVNMKEVAADLRKLLIETKEVKGAAAQIVANTDPQDPFIQIVPPFIEEAISKLANIRNDLLVAEKVFEELLKYFSSTTESSEEFFGYFTNFAQQFRNCISKLDSKKARGNKGKRLGDASDDPMANIIANIKAGKARNQS